MDSVRFIQQQDGCELSIQDTAGSTPPHTALSNQSSWHDKQRIVEMLVQAGADLNLPNALGRTAFHKLLHQVEMCHEGFSFEQRQLVILFLESGGKVNQPLRPR